MVLYPYLSTWTRFLVLSVLWGWCPVVSLSVVLSSAPAAAQIQRAASGETDELQDALPTLAILPLHRTHVQGDQVATWERLLETGLSAHLGNQLEVARIAMGPAGMAGASGFDWQKLDEVNRLEALQATFGVYGAISRAEENAYIGYLVLTEVASTRILHAVTVGAAPAPDIERQFREQADVWARLLASHPALPQRAGESEQNATHPAAREAPTIDRRAMALVEFTSAPAGASVSIGEEQVCAATPCTHWQRPGEYPFVFRLEDHDDQVVTSQLKVSSQSKRIHARLRPAYGVLRVKTDPPGMRVRVDGIEYDANKAVKGIRILAGKRRVSAVSDCHESDYVYVNISSKGNENLEMTAPPILADIVVNAVNSAGRQVRVDVYAGEELVGMTGDEISVPVCEKNLRLRYDQEYFPVILPKLSPEETNKVEAVVGMHGQWHQKSTGMAWLRVPGGRFNYGCELQDDQCEIDEQNPKIAEVSPFWIMQTEVPHAAYARCRAAGVCRDGSEGAGAVPVTQVSWFDARTFCKWAKGRIPTDAEWEFAAKSGRSHVYPWGNDAVDHKKANCRGCDDPFDLAAPVGSFPAGTSRWGVKDLAGNVWEWTVLPGAGTRVRARGGAFDSHPRQIRASAFMSIDPALRGENIGFRCVRDEVGPE